MRRQLFTHSALFLGEAGGGSGPAATDDRFRPCRLGSGGSAGSGWTGGRACCGAVRGTTMIHGTCSRRIATTTRPTIATTTTGFVWCWGLAGPFGRCYRLGEVPRMGEMPGGYACLASAKKQPKPVRPRPGEAGEKTRRRSWPVSRKAESHGRHFFCGRMAVKGSVRLYTRIDSADEVVYMSRRPTYASGHAWT